MFPIVLNLTNRLVVVLGGGRVGRRKAATLSAAGAFVRLVCLEPRPADAVPANLDWITAPYDPSHLDGAALVFAAGPPELNRRVVADAKARGLWVNSATDGTAGDFTLPATVRRGDFLVAVATGGAAPALARTIRRQLEAQFDDAFGQWVALLAEMRPFVLTAVAEEGERRALFERWCQPHWLERLRREGAEAVRAAMRGELGPGSL
jgi:precorrin-2 dehydrogenase